MTYIVASLVERSIAGVTSSSKKAFELGADIVEIRLDHMSLPSLDREVLRQVRTAVRGPAVATLRSAREGGKSKLSKSKRAEALREILESRFEYVDLELESDSRVLQELRGRNPRPKTIASAHFTKPSSRETVEKRLHETCRAADFGKVAMPCEHAGQAIMLARIGMRASVAGDRFTLIGMGDQGQLTRVCARQMGSSMVYACLPGRPAAPGQLELSEQSPLASYERTVLGLVGHPVSHSVSKPMQEAALRKAGLIGTYMHLDIPEGEFDRDALETLNLLGVSGLNITIPHKLRALELCDELGASAAATGAVNTVKFAGEAVVGENTDLHGFSVMIERKINIGEDTRALVVGAGGAARAAAKAMGRIGASVTIAARDPEKARALAREFGMNSLDLRTLARRPQAFDIVVNCTPLGTTGHAARSRLPSGVFKGCEVFFDLVYNPPVTSNMKEAMRRGAKAYGGLEMLVHQGAESFRIWTGKEPDTEVMLRAARRALA
jgi:shikimate dehydrogenase/3-dehydroquinate dehydratase type I